MDIYVSFSNASDEHVSLIKEIITKLVAKGYNVISSLDGLFLNSGNGDGEEKSSSGQASALVKPFDSISESEKAFKNAKNIVVFLSDRYMRKNLHCLCELHYILEKAKDKCIMPIRLNNGGIYDNGMESYVKDAIAKIGEVYDKKYGKKAKKAKELQLIEEEFLKINSEKFNRESNENDDCATPKDIRCFFRNYYTDNLKVKIDDNSADKAVDAIVGKLGLPTNYEPIVEGKDYTVWDSFINTIKENETILLLGDSVLNVNNITLGKHLDEILLDLGNNNQQFVKQGANKGHDLREWYVANKGNDNIITSMKLNGFNKIKQEDEQLIVNDQLAYQKLQELLESNRFKIIFSSSYSAKVFDVVKEYAKEKNYILDAKELNKKRNFSKKEDDGDDTIHLSDGKEEECIQFYDLVRVSGRKNLIFSEMDFVEFAYSCISAIANERENISGKCLLALGTNFPSWVLRFIWYALTEHKTDNSIVNNSFIANTKIDKKTESLITNNGVILVEKHETLDFINRFLNKINNN